MFAPKCFRSPHRAFLGLTAVSFLITAGCSLWGPTVTETGEAQLAATEREANAVEKKEIPTAPAKLVAPEPPKPVMAKRVRYYTETTVRACGAGESNPGHDVYAVAVKARNGKQIWRTLLWTWVHPCTQQTIDGKPVALGQVGILPVSMKIAGKQLHVFSNRDQNFVLALKDGKLLEAPAPVFGTQGP